MNFSFLVLFSWEVEEPPRRHEGKNFFGSRRTILKCLFDRSILFSIRCCFGVDWMLDDVVLLLLFKLIRVFD